VRTSETNRCREVLVETDHEDAAVVADAGCIHQQLPAQLLR